MSTDAVKLARLFLKEVSAVDDPANELPGWITQKSAEGADEASILQKIRDLLGFSGTTNDEGDFDMTPEELGEAVKAAIAPLQEKVEGIEKSLEATPAPEQGAAPAADLTPETPAVPSVDDIVKAVEETLATKIDEALQPVLEVIDKTLDRIENTEKALGRTTRKSIDGQESNAGETAPTAKPDLSAAIEKAFRQPSHARVVTVPADEQ